MDRISEAYILAGGQSRRMGQDKLFIEFDGETLIGRAIRVCSGLFATVKLVAPGRDRLNSLSLDVIVDRPEADGPLGGVMAALEDCSFDACFVTAADLYDLDRATIVRLMESWAGEQYLGIEEAGLSQPLCGIYHRSALSHLTAMAQAGCFRMRDVIVGLDHRLISPASERWRNINRPQDISRMPGS